MKQSQLNLVMLQSFIIYLFSGGGSEAAAMQEMLQSAADYIAEDHVDGAPADDQHPEPRFHFEPSLLTNFIEYHWGSNIDDSDAQHQWEEADNYYWVVLNKAH